MAQHRVLVLHAVRDQAYAEAFISALRQRMPENAYEPLDDAHVLAFNLAALEQYDRLIALLTPDLLYASSSPPARALIVQYATMWEGGKRQIIPVMLRPVSKPRFVALSAPIAVEGLFADKLAEFFAREHVLDGLPNDGRPDTQYVWEEERAGGTLPPPPPPPASPAYPPGAVHGWESPAEKAPPPQPPQPSPIPYPEQPAAQPPAAPPPVPYAPPPPPFPDGAPYIPPPASGYGMPSPHSGAPGPSEEAEPPARSRGRPAERGRRTETLQFSAYHPNEAPVETWQTCLVYTHLAAQLAQVQRDAGTFTELGSAPTVAQGQSLRKMPRNIEITVEPHMDGVTFSPAQDSFLWRGEWHRSLFRYSGARQLAGTRQRGWIDIYAERISPICTLAVEFSFHSGIPAASMGVPHGINVTGNVFDTVFISYSHRDSEPMRQAREAYEKLGITAYHDDLLAAGDNYEQRLAEMIRAANVFHLLWSDASARSLEVRKEWMLAVACQKGEKFIRPWYWQQPIVPPPPELQVLRLSFRYEHLRRRLLNPATWL